MTRLKFLLIREVFINKNSNIFTYQQTIKPNFSSLILYTILKLDIIERNARSLY